MSFIGHRLEDIAGLADAAKVVVEGKTSIYELVANLTSEDVASFMGAAASAKEEGKDSFVFDGKEYPVTIAADVAKKIADSKEDEEPEDEIEEEEIVSLIDAIKSGSHDNEEEEEEEDEDEEEDMTEGGAIAANIFKSNDEVTIDVKTGVDGHQDKDEEEEDGEEIEAEEPEVKKEALDPVGKEDDDIDNDGDEDETDEYLKKKRAAIGKAIDGEEEEQKEYFDLALLGKLISEGIELDEAKMSDLHQMVSGGETDPKKLAKALGLAATDDTYNAIAALIKGMK